MHSIKNILCRSTGFVIRLFPVIPADCKSAGTNRLQFYFLCDGAVLQYSPVFMECVEPICRDPEENPRIFIKFVK